MNRKTRTTLLVALLLGPVIANADYLYSYTGMPFDESFGTPNLGTHISVSFDSSGLLAENMSYSVEQVSDFSMSDGYYSCASNAIGVSSCTAGYYSTIITNSSGSISWWSISTAFGNRSMFTTENGGAELYGDGALPVYDATKNTSALAYDAQGSTESGYWTVSSVSSVPLPSSAWLMLAGLCWLTLLTRRRLEFAI